MKQYVLGFCFVPDGTCILIEKSKPDWQAGLVNGLGGLIKPAENIYEAMVREFHEECGIATHIKEWQHGVTLLGNGWELNVLRCILGHNQPKIRDCEEGAVGFYDEPPDNMEQTARWLYWMCRDNSTFGLLSHLNGHDR